MRSRILLVLTLALSLWIAIPVPAQVQVQEKEKPTAPTPDYSKEAYVIEKLQKRIIEEADGGGTRELTAEVKILAEAGVKAFAVLSFTYTSANEVVDVNYVRVRKPDGIVVKTPDYNVQDMPAEVSRTAPMYSDVHEKHVAVKGLGVGDVLEYSIRYRVVKPQVPGHFWYEDSFVKSAILKEETLEISVPVDKYVKVVSPEFKPDVHDEGGRRIYRWTHANLEVKEKDPNEVPRRIPPNPSIQVTTFANWEDVGNWYGGLQKDSLEVTPAIRAKAAELTKDLKTDDEKIRAIYNFVSLRFHYIGLDFGIGRYQPHTADDVLGNGYGDCKDKHTLLASSLKAAGYDAWPALIHSQRKLDPELPSPAQFNHVITVVPIADQLIWLDTTPEVAPYGLLLNVLRDKQALVISSTKGPVLMRTPQNPPFPEDQEFSVEGKLGPDDVFTGHVEQSYRGDTEVVMRSWLRQVAQSQWKESVQGFSYRLGFAGDVSNVKASPPEDTDKPFKISYDYLRKDYGDWANRQFTAPLPPLGIEVTKDSRDKKPVEPVPLGAVGKIYYRSRIELPAGYSMVTPSPINLVEPYAEYHTTNAVENGLLTTSRRFDIKKNEVALDDWDSFRRFGRAVADDEFAFIRLRPSGADAAFDSLAGKDEDIGANDDIDDIFDKAKEALQRRDFARAQRLFERVIAKDAEYEDAHLDLGMALGAQRKYGEALAELRKEEEIAPDKVKTYQTAAAVTTMAGNRDEAIVQLRKLLKLDPQNSDASLSLSRWLSQDGDYSEAAEVLESAVKTSPKATPLQYALGSAYLEMGQADKAVTHLRAAVEDGGAPSHDPMLLNNVAYTLAEKKIRLELAAQYGEEALKELDERSINDVAAVDTGTRVTYQLSLVWDTLGWVYYQRGDTNRSESFVRAAWLLGQQAIVGEHLGEIYEKQGKSKEAAHLYQLALAAQSTPQFRVTQAATQLSSPAERSLDSKAYKEQHDRILSRYEKLTGKKPSVETRRLSNGEWTKTPAQELSEMRSIKLGKQAHLSGTAEFWIVFAMGEIESVQYVSGEEALEPLTEKLKAAHYPLGFPAGSKAKILRRAEVSCTPTAGCIAALVPPDNAQTGL